MLDDCSGNAANFMHLAHPIDKESWGMHYVSLNAPNIIPGNMMGYQWFDLYPNGIYFVEAGLKEKEILCNGGSIPQHTLCSNG